MVKGGAKVRLVTEGSETVLLYEANAQVAGKLAQIGSRLVDMAAKKMADDFFGNFVAQLRPAKVEAPEPETPPATPPVFEEKAVPAVAETVAPARKAWLVFALVALIILVLAALSKGIF
jgi:hypothetical protein